MNITLGEIKSLVARGDAAQTTAAMKAWTARSGLADGSFVVQRRHGQALWYLTSRGGWANRPEAAQRFATVTAAQSKLNGRPGSVVYVVE